MDDVLIEVERPEDHAAIADVVRRAFAHHPEVVDLVDAIRDRHRPARLSAPEAAKVYRLSNHHPRFRGGVDYPTAIAAISG